TSIPALIRKIFGHFLERLCDNYPLLMADLIDETEDDDYDPEVGSLGDRSDNAESKWGIYMSDPDKVLDVAGELRQIPSHEREARLKAIIRKLGGFDTELRFPPMFSLFVRQARSQDKPN
ncbi:MAG: hypothetical protein ABIB04_00620, partial [Patescibacteria group bacterium]